MEKIEFVIEDVPVVSRTKSESKTKEIIEQVLEVYNSLPINKSFVLEKKFLSAQTLKNKLKELIKDTETERLTFNKVVNKDGETVGTRINKKAQKVKSSGETTEA